MRNLPRQYSHHTSVEKVVRKVASSAAQYTKRCCQLTLPAPPLPLLLLLLLQP
jgi:hypothetical protein